ncbi:SWIB/MDM2 domain-containing protein [bacterium]|nr:SWIB/MDM2 domain-containing protein [bacterium]MBU1984135.1 SWIB/MDM2 domain-containing protein [bacterium]
MKKATAKKAPKKKATAKKATKKKVAKKKVTAKKATKKKVVKKKATAKKATKKKVVKKKVAKKATAKKPAKKKVAKKKATAKKATAKKPAKKKVVKKVKPKVKRKPNPAFMAPMAPDAVLGAVVGDRPMPRTEITKKLWDYIKKNNLQDKVNRRMINTDPRLKALFGKNVVSMFEMNKLLQAHMKKA